MDNNNNPFSRFDWSSFEKSFGRLLPDPSMKKNKEATWVEQYVQDILRHSIPPLDPYTRTGHYNAEITETEQTILIQFSIPDEQQARQIKAYVASNQVKLEGDDEHKLQMIRLPHAVIPSSCRAVYKNGSLQLHMRKLSKDEPFFEVDVRFPS